MICVLNNKLINHSRNIKTNIDMDIGINNNVHLPFEIIDSVITSNPNNIYTLYKKISNNISDTQATTDNKQIAKSKKRKRKIDGSNNYELLEYIQNNQIYYFNKSSYMKYFISNDDIDIYNIVENYILFETNIHNKTITNSMNDVMFNLESYLDNNLSVFLLDKYMNNFMKYYKLDYANESNTFIKLYIILKACNYFPNNNNNNGFDFGNIDNNYYQNLIYLINAILDDEEIIFPNKFTPEYKFIPIFRIGLGMGYGFIIGWDMLIDRMIGFVDGGSDGHEVEYNNIMIRKYLTLDRKQRFQAYENMIDKSECKKNKHKITPTPTRKLQYNMQKYGLNISKYLELFNINQSLINLENPFDYLAKHRLNILG